MDPPGGGGPAATVRPMIHGEAVNADLFMAAALALAFAGALLLLGHVLRNVLRSDADIKAQATEEPAVLAAPARAA